MSKQRVSKITLEDIHNFYLASHLIPFTSSMREAEVSRIVEIVESFAKKLVDAATKAVNGELRHAASGSEASVKDIIRTIKGAHRGYRDYCRDASEEGLEEDEIDTEEEYVIQELAEWACEVDVGSNVSIIKAQFGSLEEFEKLRSDNKITLTQAASLFNRLEWENEYGEGYGDRKWAKIAEAAAQLQKFLPVTEQNLGDVVVWVDHLIDLEHNNALFLQSYCGFRLHNFLESKGKMEASDFKKASPTLHAMYQRHSSMSGCVYG
jgi:hypothetical protein